MEDRLIAVQDVLNSLDTSKATLYKHLKKVRIQTIKVKGKAFIQKKHVNLVKKSLGCSLDSLDELNSSDTDKTVLNNLNDRDNQGLQTKLEEQVKLLEEQKEQVTFLRTQIEDLTSALTNQQKLQLMDKSILQNLKEEMKLLEYKNQELEQDKSKDSRVFKVVQLAIYLGLIITLVVVNQRLIAFNPFGNL